MWALLLWYGLACGPADHIILLPDEGTCRALLTKVEGSPECRELDPWDMTFDADWSQCEAGYP